MLPDSGRKVKQQLNLHMTLTEWKIIMQHIKKTKSLKWFVFLNLLSFRGLRPVEACAINILDFADDFTKLTYREAKTNKLRTREHIIPELAKLIKAYVVLNQHNLADGYLFPYYKKKSKGRPYMCRDAASAWFCEIRNELKTQHKAFDEWYPVQTQITVEKRYRINLYSFRRFFETYIYLNNQFAPMSTALIKELMEYGSKFDPIKHYIKVVHQEEQKAQILDNTLTPLAKYLTEGQTQLAEFA
jgi:integrase